MMHDDVGRPPQPQVWNEREAPAARLSLGPTHFRAAAGFKGSLELFERGEVLLGDEYWAKVLCAGNVLRLRVKVAGLA